MVYSMKGEYILINRCIKRPSKHKLLISLLLSFILVLNMFPTVTANASESTLIYFEENFNTIEQYGSFPSGWKLVNVDGKTPNSLVAFVYNAWIIREDYKYDNENMVMFSTSWYTPLGASDDWVWTPLIADLPAGSTLSWQAVSYDPAFPDFEWKS